MNCPACKNASLNPIACEGQEVDVCRRCGGIWFDKDELIAVVNSMISNNEVNAQTLKEAYRGKPVSNEMLQNIKRVCPRCQMEMEMRNYSYDSNIIIDCCPSCDGIWTDAGEMRAVAKYIKGNPEMTGFAQSLVEVHQACRKTKSRKGRIIALTIALAYMAGGFCTTGLDGAINAAGTVWMPLVFIYWGDSLADVIGGRFRPSGFGPIITQSSPGGIIVFLAWVWLILVPLVAFAILRWGV